MRVRPVAPSPPEVFVEMTREGSVYRVGRVEVFLVFSFADGQDFLSVCAA